MKRVYLNNNWKYRKVQKEIDWYAASVPGNIHLDLLANNAIPDPYYRNNEQHQQWIGESDWEYQTQFQIDEKTISSKNIELVFDGLDTYADVFLNDDLILQADNMYCGWRINVKDILKPGNNNLRVYFHSVIKKTLPLFNENGFEYPANSSQPEPKLSVYTRKPGYHFGWDWGPRLLTCGLWRPVYLEVWNQTRLDNVRFVQKSLTESLAQLQLEAEIISSAKTSLQLNLSDSQNSFSPLTRNYDVKPGLNKVVIDFEIANPERWWCNGLGKAHLYELKLDILYNNELVDSWNKRIGLRTIELIHEKDKYGKSFYFKLNNVPVFVKGANFLPVDYFIPRVKEDDYRKLLKNVVDSNMNMLRLWGGAVYEEDIFYELCDEMGIMVWQDFMFACAMYPADEAMSNSIKNEAEYNVKRLRNHACLVIWCGNNEMDEGWHTWKWQERYNYSEETCNIIWSYYCKIFLKILPDTIKHLDPARPYWSSSPKFGFVDERSKTIGDMHYWGVWFLNHPREKFKEYLPRFMSEYGLQSLPELETFKKFTLPGDRDLKSEVMLAHQRQYPNPRKGQMLGGYEMIIKYLGSEYNIPDNFEMLIYASQLLQADYLKYAIETHRRNKPYCMGTMYWQINDVWPVTSWSTIDYYGRWKAAHYAVQKAYNPVIVSVSEEGDLLKIFVVNDLFESKNAELVIQLLDFTGKILFEKRNNILIPPNGSKSFFEINKQELLHEKNPDALLLYVGLKENDELLADNIFYFNYTNQLNLDESEIQYSISESGGEYQIILKANKLAKNVKIDIQDSDGFLSDNYFDLIPGREKIVTFKTSSKWEKQLNILHYCMIKNHEVLKNKNTVQ